MPLNEMVEAFILAGGKGKRMSPLTDSIPKALVKTKGKCLIQYSIEALVFAEIRQISIVTSSPSLFHKNYTYETIVTEGVENIYYVFWKCILKSKYPFALFIDGDSVCEPQMIEEFLNHTNNNYDVLVCLGKKSPSSSMWSYIVKENEIVDIVKSKSYPRCCYIVNSMSAKKLMDMVSHKYDIESHKYENLFLRGYEKYYLGWGLIIKLFLEYGFVVKVVYSESFFMNVNTVSDLNFLEELGNGRKDNE